MAALDGLSDDFRDLLVALADAEAEFVVVGGWAMAVHGRPRATEDLDVLVRADDVNAGRVFDALTRFGAPLAAHGVTREHFAVAGRAYRFGVKPTLVELLTKISGVSFEQAAHAARTVEVDGRTVRVIGRSALLTNKRAAARPKDLDDVEWLERNSEPAGRD